MDSKNCSVAAAGGLPPGGCVPSPLPVWLLVLTGLLVFSPLLEGGTTHIAVMIIRLMVLALACLYLVGLGKSGTVVLPPAAISAAVLAFLGLAALSATFSPYTHQSVQWLAVLFTYAVLFYLLVSFISGWDHIAVLLVVLLSMGLLEVGWALWQGWWGGDPRPNGTFFNPNFLAGYVAAVWAVALGYLCYAKIGRRGWPGVRRYSVVDVILPILLLSLLLLVIVWTGSRGGILAVAVGSTFVVGLRFGRRGFGLFVLALGLLVVLVPNPLRERIWAEHAVNPVGYARWDMWQQSLRQMTEHPWGVGLGLYQYIYPQYAFPVEGHIARYGKVAQTPHSEYVQMGVELGVVSIPIFGWGIIRVARESAALLRQRLRRWQRGVVVGVSAAVAAIVTHAAVDSNLHEPAIAIVLTLCAGIILAAQRVSGCPPDAMSIVSIQSRRSRLVCAGGGLLVVVGLAVGTVRLGFAWLAYDMGSAALAHKEYARAIVEYQRAIELDPGKALYHSSMAAAQFQLFEQAGDHARALTAVSELESALALNPLDGRLSGLLGLVYERVASVVPPSPGSAAMEQERRMAWRRGALSAYERAIRLEPFNPFHRLDAARLYLAFGFPEQAEASVHKAVEIEPNFLPGREWLATRYLRSARIELARREYREILERQQQYAGWDKSAFEARLLAADAAGLAAALEGRRPRT
jgi:O-antigen ligase/polysaccharide polymerase Wzy-like membrane protein